MEDMRAADRSLLWGLVPMFVVQLALFVVPLAIMFVYSFWTTKNFQIVTEWTLVNYRTFFDSWTYPKVLLRTLVSAIVITVLTIAAAYPLAYVIVRYAKRWQKILLAAVILSFWTSGLLRAYAWMALLGDAGIINKGLRTIGLIDAPLPFLLYSPFAVVLVMTYFSLPFAVITIYASLEKMDWALVDAASDLGASPLRAFRHVTLPQTWPGVISATVLTIAMAYPLAYVIARYAKRWQKVLIAAVILSFWTSGLLRAYAWMALLGDAGIINKGLKALGLIDAPLPFLLYSPFAVVLVMTYFSLPFAVIAIYASLEKMDWSLVDAASDLGASPLRAFRHVTLPQTWPGVISATVLTFVPLTGMFFVPMLVGDASSVMIAPLIANQMQAFQLGLGAALSFIVAVVVMGALALSWRHIQFDAKGV